MNPIFITLPLELQYKNEQGDTITTLPLEEFLHYVATLLKEIKSSQNIQNSKINSTMVAVNTVQQNVSEINIPDMNVTIPELFEDNLEHSVQEFANQSFLKTKFNTTQSGNLTQAYMTMETLLSGKTKLENGEGNVLYQSDANWSDETTLSALIQNLIVVVSDLRNVISTIPMSSQGCESILIALSKSLNEVTNTLDLRYFGNSTIPSTYKQGTISIKIKDYKDNNYYKTENSLSLLTHDSTLSISLDQTPLIGNTDYNVETIVNAIDEKGASCKKENTIVVTGYRMHPILNVSVVDEDLIISVTKIKSTPIEISLDVKLGSETIYTVSKQTLTTSLAYKVPLTAYGVYDINSYIYYNGVKELSATNSITRNA